MIEVQSNQSPTVKEKVATTVKKMIIVAVLILIAIVLLSLNEYGKSSNAWCFEGKDVCTLKAMDKLRAERDSRKADLQKQIIDTETYYNNKINPLKSALTGETISNELKAGRKQNVPESILSFRIVPQVMADEPTKEVVLGPVSWSPGNTRYKGVLQQANSPYSEVPIETYCRVAGITIDQCDILVGICQAESGNGIQYRRLDRETNTIVSANSTGKQVYNCAGLKGGGISYPTEDGWYIRQFKSWDDFWSQFPFIMKQGYFDRGGNTPEIISKCYVRGDCSTIKWEWVGRVKDLINKL